MDINSSRVLETTEGGMEKLAEVTSWRDSKLFSEAERLALEYAERITYTDQQVDDDVLQPDDRGVQPLEHRHLRVDEERRQPVDVAGGDRLGPP